MRRVHGEATECVVFMGRGVAYRKTEETNLCWSAYGETGSCSSTVYCLALASTGYCSSTATVHPASTVRYSTGYCSTTPPRAPLHHLLFI